MARSAPRERLIERIKCFTVQDVSEGKLSNRRIRLWTTARSLRAFRADDSNTSTYCVGIDSSVGGGCALQGSGALARSSATRAARAS